MWLLLEEVDRYSLNRKEAWDNVFWFGKNEPSLLLTDISEQKCGEIILDSKKPIRNVKVLQTLIEGAVEISSSANGMITAILKNRTVYLYHNDRNFLQSFSANFNRSQHGHGTKQLGTSERQHLYINNSSTGALLIFDDYSMMFWRANQKAAECSKILGEWFEVPRDPEVILPPASAKEACVTGIFFDSEMRGEICLCAISWFDANDLIYVVVFITPKNFGVECEWKLNRVNLLSIHQEISVSHVKDSLIASLSPNGSTLALLLNQDTALATCLVYISIWKDAVIATGMFDRLSAHEILPGRRNWFTDLSWSRDSTFLFILSKIGELMVASHLGMPVYISTDYVTTEASKSVRIPIIPAFNSLVKEQQYRIKTCPHNPLFLFVTDGFTIKTLTIVCGTPNLGLCFAKAFVDAKSIVPLKRVLSAGSHSSLVHQYENRLWQLGRADSYDVLPDAESVLSDFESRESNYKDALQAWGLLCALNEPLSELFIEISNACIDSFTATITSNPSLALPLLSSVFNCLSWDVDKGKMPDIASILIRKILQIIISEKVSISTLTLAFLILRYSKMKLAEIYSSSEVFNISTGAESCLLPHWVFLYLQLCAVYNCDAMSRNEVAPFTDLLVEIQKELTCHAVDFYFLHTLLEADQVVENMLEGKSKKVLADLHARSKLAPSKDAVRIKTNAYLSLLYMYLSRGNVHLALTLIDKCVRVFFALEDEVTETSIHQMLQAPLKRIKLSFLQLIASDISLLESMPFSCSLYPMESRDAVLSFARVIANVYLDSEVFVYPSHFPKPVDKLTGSDQNRDVFRRIYLDKHHIKDVLLQHNLSSDPPRLVLSLFILGESIEEACFFCSKLGNHKLSAALFHLHSNFTGKQELKSESPLKEFIINVIKERIQTEHKPLTGFSDMLSDSFRVLMMFNVDFLTDVIQILVNNFQSQLEGVGFEIDSAFYLPAPAVFMPQNRDNKKTSVSSESETKVRSRLSVIYNLYSTVLNASNISSSLIKWYLQEIIRTASNKSVAIRSFPDNLFDISSAESLSDMNDTACRKVFLMFRHICIMLWVLHCRDQFNIAFRAYSATFYKFCYSRNEHDYQSEAFENLKQLWRICMNWAKFLLPFAKCLEFEDDFVQFIISLFIQQPVSEEVIVLAAQFFYKPRRKDPEVSEVEDVDGAVFDWSNASMLSQLDYDVLTSEQVPLSKDRLYKQFLKRISEKEENEGERINCFMRHQKKRREYLNLCSYATEFLWSNAVVGSVEFEHSDEFFDFLLTMFEVSFEGASSSQIPMLPCYYNQLQKQIFNEIDSSQPEFGNDAIVVTAMRNCLMQCVKLPKGNGDVTDASHLDDNSSQTSIEVKKELIPVKPANEIFAYPSTVHKSQFETSMKESIVYELLLQGRVFYGKEIDAVRAVVQWLLRWVNRSQSLQIRSQQGNDVHLWVGCFTDIILAGFWHIICRRFMRKPFPEKHLVVMLPATLMPLQQSVTFAVTEEAIGGNISSDTITEVANEDVVSNESIEIEKPHEVYEDELPPDSLNDKLIEQMDSIFPQEADECASESTFTSVTATANLRRSELSSTSESPRRLLSPNRRASSDVSQPARVQFSFTDSSSPVHKPAKKPQKKKSKRMPVVKLNHSVDGLSQDTLREIIRSETQAAIKNALKHKNAEDRGNSPIKVLNAEKSPYVHPPQHFTEHSFLQSNRYQNIEEDAPDYPSMAYDRFPASDYPPQPSPYPSSQYLPSPQHIELEQMAPQTPESYRPTTPHQTIYYYKPEKPKRKEKKRKKNSQHPHITVADVLGEQYFVTYKGMPNSIHIPLLGIDAPFPIPQVESDPFFNRDDPVLLAPPKQPPAPFNHESFPSRDNIGTFLEFSSEPAKNNDSEYFEIPAEQGRLKLLSIPPPPEEEKVIVREVEKPVIIEKIVEVEKPITVEKPVKPKSTSSIGINTISLEPVVKEVRFDPCDSSSSTESVEVEEPTGIDLTDNATSPMPSPRKKVNVIQTQTEDHAALPDPPVGNDVQRLITPDVFLNLHFPQITHGHSARNFINVADINNDMLEEVEDSRDRPPDTIGDLHWRIVDELRRPQSKMSSPRRYSPRKSSPRSTRNVETSPITSPRKNTPRESEKSELQSSSDSHSEQEVIDGADELTKQILTPRKVYTNPVPEELFSYKKQTHRGRSMRDQLLTMNDQLSAMDEMSRKIAEELQTTHTVMRTVENLNQISQPRRDSPRRPHHVEVDSESGNDENVPENITDVILSSVDKPNFEIRESSLKSLASSIVGPIHGFQNGSEKTPQTSTPRESHADIEKLCDQENLHNAYKQFMKQKEPLKKETPRRKESPRRPLHSLANRTATVSNWNKRFEIAKELMHDMLDEPPEVRTARTARLEVSTPRANTRLKKPPTARKPSIPVAKRTAKSKSPSTNKNHVSRRDVPPPFTSWYEYHRSQAQDKLEQRRRITQEIRQEELEEKNLLLEKLNELGKGSVSGNQRVEKPNIATSKARYQPADHQRKVSPATGKRGLRSRSPPHKPKTYVEQLQMLSKKRSFENTVVADDHFVSPYTNIYGHSPRAEHSRHKPYVTPPSTGRSLNTPFDGMSEFSETSTWFVPDDVRKILDADNQSRFSDFTMATGGTDSLIDGISIPGEGRSCASEVNISEGSEYWERIDQVLGS